MNCPTCIDERLVMTDRSGIEIDYCPKCRGVWLDRGELDKIIERSQALTPPPPTPSPSERDTRARSDDRHDRDHRHDYDRDHRGDRDDRFDDGERGTRRPKRRRESLLGELFDF